MLSRIKMHGVWGVGMGVVGWGSGCGCVCVSVCVCVQYEIVKWNILYLYVTHLEQQDYFNTYISICTREVCQRVQNALKMCSFDIKV